MMSIHRNNDVRRRAATRQVSTWGYATLAFLALIAFTGPSLGDTIRLRQSATAEGAIKLSTVAALDGEQARALGDTIIAEFDSGQRSKEIILRTVRQTLSQKDVNWGRLSLSGFMQCRVTRPGNADDAEASDAEGGDAAADQTSTERSVAGSKSASADRKGSAANVTRAVEAGQAATLRQRVTRAIHQMSEFDRKSLKITFADRDKERLNQSVLGKQYELEPRSNSALGRVPIAVRRYEGGRVADRFTISADVTRKVKALVAQDSISRGDTFQGGDVAVETVWLERDDNPIADPALIQGQRADSILRKGHVIYPDDVKSPTLVKRGQLITVRCLTDGLVVRTTVRAREDGTRDEVIKVRNEGSRETFTCTVTGPRTATVDLRQNAGAASAVTNAKGPSQ
jgi:flagella basal body P-ring formation protein FlgA